MFFALLFIAFVIWMYWATFFKKSRDLTIQTKKNNTLIERNSQTLENAILIKKNKMLILEKDILEHYNRFKLRSHLYDFVYVLPYGIEEKIKECSALEYSEKNIPISQDLRLIIVNYRLKIAEENAKRGTLLQRQAINNKQHKEWECEQLKNEASKEEKRLRDERCKNMSREELDLEALTWYEIQAEIARGK